LTFMMLDDDVVATSPASVSAQSDHTPRGQSAPGSADPASPPHRLDPVAMEFERASRLNVGDRRGAALPCWA